MKRIRICEESEARLMIRDGSFQQFVKMWCEQFPQKDLFTVFRKMRDEYGYYNRRVAEQLGIGETILLEVGENIIFRKKFNVFSIYQKIGTIWVRKNGGLDIVSSEESLFSQPEKVLPFCEENVILGAKNLTEFAYSLKGRKILSDWRRPLLKFGNHEIWRRSPDRTIEVYSHLTYEDTIFEGVNYVVGHIQDYQKKYKTAFGPM